MRRPHRFGTGRLSYWIDTAAETNYPHVEQDELAEVVIVGAGVTGITAAYLLAKAGRSVVVVDRERIVMAETGHTTAHLQVAMDTRLQTLVSRFGLEGAKAGWDSQRKAVEIIESIVRQEGIDCELRRLDAYLYGPRDEDIGTLRKEAELTRRIGYEVEEVSPDAIPFNAKAVLRFPNQGKVHPRKYLIALAQKAQALGARIFEGTEIERIESGRPVVAHTRDGHRLVGDWLISATQTPLNTRIRPQWMLTPFHSYVIGARVPPGTFSDALYWDTLDPYHYTRVEPGKAPGGGDLVILGGEDQQSGSEGNTEERYEALERHLREIVDDAEVVYRWSAEDLESPDGYPLIGHVPLTHANELVGTAYSGTGITHGTLAGWMLSERILGRETPWDDLYSPGRFTWKRDVVKEVLKLNLGNAKRLLESPFSGERDFRVEELQPGEGAVVRQGFQKVAVSRTRDGELHAVHATCQHLGCTVAWNEAEETWDCPCHGSRYAPDGEVLHGPTRQPLPPYALEELPQPQDKVGRQAKGA